MNYRCLKAMGAILLVTLLFACSFKTYYNNMDYLILEYVEGMVTLDDVLEDKLEHRAGLLIDWHRNTQLELYADWLRNVQHDVDTGMTEQDVTRHINTLEQYWQALSVKINDEMAMLLPLLDAKQQEELFSSISEHNNEFREHYVDISKQEREQSYHERLLDTSETWIGTLNSDQENEVKKTAQSIVSGAAQRLQRRLLWQQTIRGILAEKYQKDIKTERLRHFMTDFENQQNAVLAQQTEHNRKVIAQLVLRLANTMDEKQKAHFRNKTDDYIHMFVELSRNSE